MDAIRRWLVLALAVGQAITPRLVLGDFSGSRLTSTQPTPLVPAGYAFIVWGPIFGLCIAFAFAQLFGRGRDNPLLSRLRWPLGAVFALCIGWLIAAANGPMWATVFIFIAVVVILARALVEAEQRRDGPGGWQRWVTSAMLGLYAGWSSIALFANTAEALSFSQMPLFAENVVPACLVLLGLAALVAASVLWFSGGQIFYLAAVIWALVGIAVGNERSTGSPLIAGSAIVAALLLVGLAFLAGREAADFAAKS